MEKKIAKDKERLPLLLSFPRGGHPDGGEE